MTTRRRKAEPRPLPEGWERHTEWRLDNGRILRPGTEFIVDGERGTTYKFLSATITPSSMWIDAWGGCTRDPGGVRQLRAFHPDRIRKVLNKPRIKYRRGDERDGREHGKA